MQNKQAVIGIIAAIIILLGAGGVFLYSKNRPQPVQNPPTAKKEENKNSSASGNILEILKSGQTQECTFSSGEENASTSGVVYLSNQEFRVDFTVIQANDKSDISMIRKGDDNYIWGSGFPNNAGLKMTLSIDKLAEDEQTKDYFNTDQQVDYSCKSWAVDSFKFNPPSNIKFTNFSGRSSNSAK